MKPRMVDIPVMPSTRKMLKKIKGDLSYDEFLKRHFGGGHN